MASREIPSDIVPEILTRTKSLAALAGTKMHTHKHDDLSTKSEQHNCTIGRIEMRSPLSFCKEWNQMIHDSDFMRTYYRTTKNLSGYFIQDRRPSETPSVFVWLEHDQSSDNDGEGQNSQSDDVSMADDIIPLNVRILASCNQGLLCCVQTNINYSGSGYNYLYYICKPATKQWQPLPEPKLGQHSVSESLIVLSSSPLRYKIVRLSSGGPNRLNSTPWHNYYYCEIFDSQFWEWRKIQASVMTDSVFLPNTSLVVSRTNSIYWLTCGFVVHFDYVQECFNRFPLPTPAFKFYHHKTLVDCQGKLGLTCVKENYEVELWLHENVEGWRKKKVMYIGNLKELVETVPNRLVGFYINGEVALVQTRDQVVFYEVRDGCFGKAKLRDGMRGVHEVFPFRSDFEPVELKGADCPSRVPETIESRIEITSMENESLNTQNLTNIRTMNW